MFKGKSPQTAPLSAATPLQSSSSTCEWLNWPMMLICWSPLLSLSPWSSSFASWSWWPSLSRCWWSPLHIPRPGSLRTADRSPCCIPPPAGSLIIVLFWSFCSTRRSWTMLRSGWPRPGTGEARLRTGNRTSTSPWPTSWWSRDSSRRTTESRRKLQFWKSPSRTTKTRRRGCTGKCSVRCSTFTV